MAERQRLKNGLDKAVVAMTEPIFTVRLDRVEAQELGRIGILKAMQEKYAHLQLDHVAFAPDWSVDSEAWCYGDKGHIRLVLTGVPGSAITETMCSPRMRRQRERRRERARA